LLTQAQRTKTTGQLAAILLAPALEECVRTTATSVPGLTRQGHVVDPAVGNAADHQVKIFQAVFFYS